jgi:light-regulated signal transduction histidine kinase (bacteriophytochrome)
MDVSVTGSELGIYPQYFERIFRTFQRLQKREVFDGTSIGLAICKKIAELQGGQFSVESRSQYGSTFGVVLAASDAES